MSIDELIRALEGVRESQAANSSRAWDAHHLEDALRLAAKDHQAALDQVIRCNARAKALNATPDDVTSLNLAQEVMRARWEALARAREQAERFLGAAG